MRDNDQVGVDHDMLNYEALQSSLRVHLGPCFDQSRENPDSPDHGVWCQDVSVKQLLNSRVA